MKAKEVAELINEIDTLESFLKVAKSELNLVLEERVVSEKCIENNDWSIYRDRIKSAPNYSIIRDSFAMVGRLAFRMANKIKR